MKTLQTIQKAMNVFRIIAKVASVFCIVSAVISGVGALCAVTQYNGGQVLWLLGEPFDLFADGTDLLQKYVYLLSVTFMLISEAILLGLVRGYLKSEQADGTPFTENGADRLKRLGIRFIWIPAVTIAVSEAVAVLQGVEITGPVSNLESVLIGIILIFVSVISRYGAELENKNQDQIEYTKQINSEGESL